MSRVENLAELLISVPSGPELLGASGLLLKVLPVLRLLIGNYDPVGAKRQEAFIESFQEVAERPGVGVSVVTVAFSEGFEIDPTRDHLDFVVDKNPQRIVEYIHALLDVGTLPGFLAVEYVRRVQLGIRPTSTCFVGVRKKVDHLRFNGGR